jgi:proteasome-associated ATPase
VSGSRKDDAEARAARYEKEVADLQTQVGFLEEEAGLLRRKLTDSPRQTKVLEERLTEAQSTMAALTGQNERLVATLKEAKEQILALKEEVDRLAQPPSGYGIFLAGHDDGTVDVFHGGRKIRVTVSPTIDVTELRKGQEVMLNEALNVVRALEFERQGDVVML